MTLPTQRLRSGAASVPSPLGYDTVRQRGSHVRITTRVNGEHHEVIPLHAPIRVKTLSSILKSIARHHEMTVEELLRVLDL